MLADTGRRVGLDAIHSAYVRADPWWLATYGSKNLGEEEANEAFKELDAKVFMRIFPKEPPEEAETVSRLARARWPLLEKEIPSVLYPDAEPLLRSLNEAGFTLGLVSNAPPDAASVIESVGLNHYIEHIVVSGVVGIAKPNPEIFRIALSKTGGKSEETVHVGDLYEADVVGARNAGIRGILLDRDGVRKDADCDRIESLDQLMPLVR